MELSISSTETKNKFNPRILYPTSLSVMGIIKYQGKNRQVTKNELHTHKTLHNKNN
jgi:hypothetical protein